LTLAGNTVAAREPLFTNLNERIRDVRQGPDGWLYLLTDGTSGRIVRIVR
jgi:glucose/arabinose dehydrogenase